MTTTNTINFKGKSGERYAFQAFPLETKFKAVGAVYLVTERTFDDTTFRTRASHRSIAIGQTADLATSLIESERVKLRAKGANCICVCAEGDETRRVEIERDLIEGNEAWGGKLQYLFHATVPEKAPGQFE